ncbi:MAG TPA: DUF4870 domain-containing protein, partial [Thermaerobacter sp.]
MEGNVQRQAGGSEWAGGSSRTWAVLCHLAALAWWILPGLGHLLGPFVVWLIKRGDDDFVDAHGKEAINFQISATIYGLVLMVAAVVLLFPVGMELVGSTVGWREPWPPRLLTFLG